MKNKKFDPFKNLVLSPYEQEIEDNLENWKSIPNLEAEKKRYAQMARNTLQEMKRQRDIEVRTKTKSSNIDSHSNASDAEYVNVSTT